MSFEAAKTVGERDRLHDIMAHILTEFPKRRPASEDEREAQKAIGALLEELGLETETHAFRFNDNLYANLVLHFGLGVLGHTVGGLVPPLGAALHGLAATSYLADSTRRGYILRRILGFKPSQNLLATLPAVGEPKLRVVFVAHADTALTGLLFEPWLVQRFAGTPPPGLGFLERPIELAVKTELAQTALCVLRTFLGPLGLPLRPLEAVLNLPALLTTLLALDVVLRDHVVPGAADNLSGAAALPLLAARLMRDRRPDVEYVFALTGCEEASLGGADALARDMKERWDTEKTVVIALDTFSNGDLAFVETEGEVIRSPAPPWLCDTIRKEAATEPRFNDIRGIEVPVGGSDAAAFLAHGWEAVCLTCLDHDLGAPHHYHHPSDTLEHIDFAQIIHCLDFTEKLTHAIVRRRLGGAPIRW